MTPRKKEREKVARRFGENLARLRSERAMPQAEVAKLTGLNRTEISLLERGKRSPGLETMVRLAAVLEVSVDEFVDGIDWVEPNAGPTAGFFDVTP